MIDPKLNELPASSTAKGGQTSPKPAQARKGLSINDTIAGDANLSAGARGVDTSGVRAGAGAGAGSSFVTPGESGAGSPAPNVQPGPGRTGTTPAAGQGVIGRSDTGLPGTGETELDETSRAYGEAAETSGRDDFSGSDDLDYEVIRVRAYECWCERGCPEGSPEEDWHRAEQEYRTRRSSGDRANAAGV